MTSTNAQVRENQAPPKIPLTDREKDLLCELRSKRKITFTDALLFPHEEVIKELVSLRSTERRIFYRLKDLGLTEITQSIEDQSLYIVELTSLGMDVYIHQCRKSKRT